MPPMKTAKAVSTEQRLNTHVTTGGHRLTLPASGALTLSTSFQTIPGLTTSLAVGTWHIYARMLMTNPGTAGQGFTGWQVTGSGGLTASNGRWSVTELVTSGTVAAADFNTLGSPINSTVVPGTGGAPRVAEIQGLFIISVAGTISIQMKQATAAACTVVQYGTFAEVFLVT